MIERNAEIIRLWNADYSAKEIGVHLGITKNVVIGVVTRLRDSGSDLITRPKIENPVACGLHGQRRVRVSHKKNFGEKKPRPKVVSLPKLFQAPPKRERADLRVIGISLYDLESHSCRYPTSRVDEQHYFCGDTIKDHTSSYCEKHHSLVWLKRKKMTQEETIKMRARYEKKQWLKGSSAARLMGSF